MLLIFASVFFWRWQRYNFALCLKSDSAALAIIYGHLRFAEVLNQLDNFLILYRGRFFIITCVCRTVYGSSTLRKRQVDVVFFTLRLRCTEIFEKVLECVKVGHAR